MLPNVLVPVLAISFFTAILTVLIGSLLSRRVVRPLADVIAAASQVAAGDLSARVQINGPGDLRTLTDSFNQMAETLEISDQQRRALLADVEYDALHDPLTNLPNRRLFFNRLEHALAWSKRNPKTYAPCAICF